MDLTTSPLRLFVDSPFDGRHGALHIRVDVDRNHCHRYAICEQEAPEVFRLRPDGRLEYHASPDPGQCEAVRQAARVCPMQAISVKEQLR